MAKISSGRRRADNLTLYALASPTDGTTTCPKCSTDDHDGMSVAFGDRYMGDTSSFTCLCCSYRFEGIYVKGDR